MSYETETLKLLRQSLDEEEEETSIVAILENHHKYLREYINILTSPEILTEHKQAIINLFIPIFRMHSQAEKQTFYKMLKEAPTHELRLEGLKASDELDIALEIIDELHELDVKNSWNVEIESKIRVLSGLVKIHIKEEETRIFSMAERFYSESRLIGLTDDYLEKCKMYLDMEMKMESVPSAVSRSDVLTFFY